MPRTTGTTGTSGWKPESTLLAFGAGALLALAASRLAPPAAARAIGATRAYAGADPFDLLARDHRLVLGLLTLIERTDDSARVRRAALLFQVKRMLTAHALAEEDVVYPMLYDEAERKQMANRLYREHATLKIRLYELEHMDKGDPAWIEKLRELRKLIEDHARDEEENEFPALRAAIGEDRERMARVFGDVQREKSLAL